MFGQDCDSVGEFCSLNVVNHLFRRPKKGRNFFVVEKGCWILARPQVGGKSRITAPINLTAIYAVADNNGLFLGVPVRLLPEPVRMSWLPIGTLAAEVFVA